MNERIINFFRFLYERGLDGSICFFEGEFHAMANLKSGPNNDGNLGETLASGQGKTPNDALDELLGNLNKIGF